MQFPYENVWVDPGVLSQTVEIACPNAKYMRNALEKYWKSVKSLVKHVVSQAIGIREHQFEAEMLEKHYLQIRIAWHEVGVQENRLGNH